MVVGIGIDREGVTEEVIFHEYRVVPKKRSFILESVYWGRDRNGTKRRK
jgi:hypothetical protein